MVSLLPLSLVLFIIYFFRLGSFLLFFDLYFLEVKSVCVPLLDPFFNYSENTAVRYPAFFIMFRFYKDKQRTLQDASRMFCTTNSNKPSSSTSNKPGTLHDHTKPANSLFVLIGNCIKKVIEVCYSVSILLCLLTSYFYHQIFYMCFVLYGLFFARIVTYVVQMARPIFIRVLKYVYLSYEQSGYSVPRFIRVLLISFFSFCIVRVQKVVFFTKLRISLLCSFFSRAWASVCSFFGRAWASVCSFNRNLWFKAISKVSVFLQPYEQVLAQFVLYRNARFYVKQYFHYAVVFTGTKAAKARKEYFTSSKTKTDEVQSNVTWVGWLVVPFLGILGSIYQFTCSVLGYSNTYQLFLI